MQFSHKFVNFFFKLVLVKDKLTGLGGIDFSLVMTKDKLTNFGGN